MASMIQAVFFNHGPTVMPIIQPDDYHEHIVNARKAGATNTALIKLGAELSECVNVARYGTVRPTRVPRALNEGQRLALGALALAVLRHQELFDDLNVQIHFDADDQVRHCVACPHQKQSAMEPDVKSDEAALLTESINAAHPK